MVEQERITDESGLSRIYREHRGELLRFLAARTGNPGDAEELVQELWLRIQSAPGGPVTNGRAYLYRAAQNLVLDRARERRRRSLREEEWFSAHHDLSGGEPVDGRTSAEGTMLEREETAALASAIAALPEGAGRVFRLHKLEGVPHAEIAVRLGISRSGVEKHLAVAMAHLRRALLD